MAYLGSRTSGGTGEGTGGGARASAPAVTPLRGPRSSTRAGRVNQFSEGQRAAALEATMTDSPAGPDIDWDRVGLFGSGLAVGLTLGAGLALLLAPQSGVETRAALRRGGRRLGTRGRNAWDDLRDELQAATRRRRKQLSRSLQRGAWAAEDAFAERRRRRQRHLDDMDD